MIKLHVTYGKVGSSRVLLPITHNVCLPSRQVAQGARHQSACSTLKNCTDPPEHHTIRRHVSQHLVLVRFLHASRCIRRTPKTVQDSPWRAGVREPGSDSYDRWSHQLSSDCDRGLLLDHDPRTPKYEKSCDTRKLEMVS